MFALLNFISNYIDCRTLDEREEWLTALFNAVQDYFKREATLKKQDPSVVNDSIGLDEPTFVTPGTVKSCNDDHCFKTFGFMHRGSNCKACGKVA